MLNIADSSAVYNYETGRMTIYETVVIDTINAGSLADGLLEVGDVILSVTRGGKTKAVTRQYHIIDMMLDLRVGDVITLEIQRNGENMTFDITITEDCLTAY